LERGKCVNRAEGVYDFHTHSLLSDGELIPVELIRRAVVAGYAAIGITDHCGHGSLERVIAEVTADCALAREHWGIKAIPGVELTHLPPTAIPDTARRAKELGAAIVIVHGETPVEPVSPGTNEAALNCPWVDILAHPGLLTPEEAALAARKGVFLELSGRAGHCLTNGHIARQALRAGARLIVGSDAHSPDDLLSSALVTLVARGAGLDEEQYHQVSLNAHLLLERLAPPS
jgi:histidinol phosphatase-like PHP family hydrolase